MTETAGTDRPARPVRRRRPRAPVLEGPARVSAHVCQAASCLSASSDQVFDALAEQVTEAGLADVAVKRVGCLGLCAAGPLVEVPETGRLFERVRLDDLGSLVEELQEVSPGTTPAPPAPFFARQVRVATENSGRVDPEDLDDHGSAFAPTVLQRWRQRTNLMPGLALVALAAAGWSYVASHASATGSMGSMAMDSPGGAVVFLAGWTAMMTAMMVPATLPLILLYRTTAGSDLGPAHSRIGMLALLAGYLAVWAAAGMPVYGYSLVVEAAGPVATALPAALLVVGGSYQFTPLKRRCHLRCSSPLSFLLQHWRQGAPGALRLGVLHGLDCLGCCAGLMVGLVALGMMNLAWVLTAAVVIFVEKTIPGSHRLARPLGVVMIVGGLALLAASLLGGLAPEMEPM